MPIKKIEMYSTALEDKNVILIKMVNMCCSILMENLQCVLKQLLKYGEGGHKGLIV